ncbi:M16 family metallopeptidase [Prosthecodimorpha hirschii]|uniref:M16 family metallopeptidase n=1 Tax=Prosthecodimorpha hirschii TaxID=665126 RepID=UPI001FEE0433|nr:pitrilysin family protein [Prosthecomicrobium hirschii]
MTQPVSVPDTVRPLRARLAAALLTAALAGLPIPAGADTALQGSATATAANALPPAPEIGGNVTSFTLANGLQVVVVPDARAPVVTHMVWYKVGSADEPKGKSGIAHYLEHLMFKGTRDNPAGAFSKKVSEIGGQENAFTSNDYTGYFQRVAKEHLPLMMRLEADRMANLQLVEATAKPELQVVLEERSQRTDNDPSAQLGEAMEATLYQASPYRIPVIGWRHEIEQLTYKDAMAFYDLWYTPNNAVLIVAGDVDPASVRKLAEETYGKVARRAEPGVRIRPTEPEALASRTVTLADERVNQPSLRMAWVVPSYRTAAKSEAEAIDLLAEVVGSGPTSRLYRELVIEKGLAASAGGYYQSTAWDDTKIMFYATPRDGVTLDQLKAAVDEVLAAVVRDGVNEAELNRAKRKIVANAIHAQDSQASLARIFGTALTTGSTVEDVRTWPAKVYAVTPDDVKKVATTYLRKDIATTAFLVSAPPTGKKPTARAQWPVAGPGSGAIR